VSAFADLQAAAFARAMARASTIRRELMRRVPPHWVVALSVNK
jgi:hypothetical protein